MRLSTWGINDSPNEVSRYSTRGWNLRVGLAVDQAVALQVLEFGREHLRFPVDTRSVIPVIPVHFGDSFNMVLQS